MSEPQAPLIRQNSISLQRGDRVLPEHIIKGTDPVILRLGCLDLALRHAETVPKAFELADTFYAYVTGSVVSTEAAELLADIELARDARFFGLPVNRNEDAGSRVFWGNFLSRFSTPLTRAPE